MLLKFTTEAEWLEARKQDVTSTDMAALFGLHPYKSRLRLWLEKAGEIEPDVDEDNPFLVWGRRLQIPVAMGICEDEGWRGSDLTGYYYRDPERRMGASLDVLAECPARGRINLEVKIAESFSEDLGWLPDSAPIQYEFQMQAQMHEAAKNGTPFDCSCLGAFGRRQSVRMYFRTYDADLGALMDAEVDGFWKSIRNGVQPKPDYRVDGPLLERIAKPVRAGEMKNLSTNNRAVALASDYAFWSANLKDRRKETDDISKRLDAIKAELHDIAGDAETVIIGDFQVGMKKQTVEDSWRPAYDFRRFDFKKLKKGV